MSRAHGKHGPRDVPQPAPGTPEGNYIGVEDPHQPGGQNHIGNTPVETQKVPVPQHRPTYRGMMAHGVSAPATHYEREDISHAKAKAKVEPPPKEVVPVPVVIVEGQQGSRPLKTLSISRIIVPAVGSAPVRICPQDQSRTQVLLFNEDSTYDIRFSTVIADLMQDPGSTLPVGGALLLHGMADYQKFDCQATMFAVCTTAHTPQLSVVMEIETRTGR